MDTLYAGYDNVRLAQKHGVELVGPTPSGSAESKNINQLNIDNFNIDETTEEVVCCPVVTGKRQLKYSKNSTGLAPRLREPTAASSGEPAWVACKCEADRRCST